MKTFIKDPDSTLDYSFDWTDWLSGSETIDSYEIDADSGIAIQSDVANSTAVTVWLVGGTVGETYKIRCEITTDHTPARVTERTILIDVQER